MKEPLNVLIDKDAKDSLRIMAQEDGRSLSGMVQVIIRDAWKEWKKKAKEGGK